MSASRYGEAGGLPVLSESFVRNGMHIGGRVVHRRNGQFLVAVSRNRAVFNVQLTLAMLRQALFAMQKILVNRIPMLFFEPRQEYVPAVRRFATAWKQLWVCQHWPAGLLTNKVQLPAHYRQKYSNVTPRGHYPAAAFTFTTRGAQAAGAINECRLMELPVFGVVNTAVHEPTVLYPIPCNDASGASFNLLLGAMQGMMLRVDQLQKKRLLMMILMEATMKNQVAQELQRRKEAFDEDWDEDDEEEARRKARRGAPGAGRGRGGANRKL